MERLLGIFPQAQRCTEQDFAQSPAEQGAYVLQIDLDYPICAMLGRQAVVLDAGRYLYAGSAWGPGGIRGRLNHHFRKDKKVHWHVDHLTAEANRVVAIAFPRISECALVDSLDELGATYPHPGFGSSDCKACTSHLVQLPT